MLTPSQRRQVRSRSGLPANNLAGLNVPVIPLNMSTVKTGRKDVLPRRIRKKPKSYTTGIAKTAIDKNAKLP